MKNVSINPFVLVLALLASFGLGALLVWSLSNKYDQGHHDGRLATQRSAALMLSTLMSEGFIVRQTDGKDVRYVLKPVAKPAP
jgi:hypothetical protein